MFKVSENVINYFRRLRYHENIKWYHGTFIRDGGEQKMVFFRMLHSDFSRMIKSWKFYLAIAFIAVLTFLSIYPEAAGSGGNCSVYYLVNARGGVSAFLVTNTILVVLPFALSYWEDVQKNYINCILPRYIAAFIVFHVLMTAFWLCFWDIRSALADGAAASAHNIR